METVSIGVISKYAAGLNRAIRGRRKRRAKRVETIDSYQFKRILAANRKAVTDQIGGLMGTFEELRETVSDLQRKLENDSVPESTDQEIGGANKELEEKVTALQGDVQGLEGKVTDLHEKWSSYSYRELWNLFSKAQSEPSPKQENSSDAIRIISYLQGQLKGYRRIVLLVLEDSISERRQATEHLNQINGMLRLFNTLIHSSDPIKEKRSEVIQERGYGQIVSNKHQESALGPIFKKAYENRLEIIGIGNH